jgi:UDP-glucose 4-epimerase
MKILLTGGAGFIGAHIAKAYVQAGHEVVVVDDLSRGYAESLPEDVSLHRVDITDPEALEAVFQAERPQIVNHHAALVSVRESASRPERYLQVNLVGTRNMLRAARAAGAEKIIYASSGGAVYGEAQNLPITEDHPLNPLSPYGESKVLAERLIREQDGRFKSVILRYGNVYGPGQDPSFGNGAVSIFTENMLRGQPITLFGSGEQLRDYLFVDDAARANIVALEPGVTGTYNLGTGCGLTLLQVLDQLAAALDREPELKFQESHPFEVWRNVLDVSRAEDHLGWRAEVDFETGLELQVTADSKQRTANS